MPFLSLAFTHFRNIQDSTIDVNAPEVFFVGENGQGKSNLLESLYYASYASSFRTHSDTEIVAYGEKDFSIRALYKENTKEAFNGGFHPGNTDLFEKNAVDVANDNGCNKIGGALGESKKNTLGFAFQGNEKTNNIGIYYSGGKKKIERNGKTVADRKELVNTIPCVLFCHDDLDFVCGEPERRRFFVDQTLTMYDALYIDCLRRYKKVLKTRNLVLKEQKYELLDVLNVQLIENGLEMQKRRREVIYEFNHYFSDLYKEVTGIENVKLVYMPSWKAENSAEIADILLQKTEMDKHFCTTMSGPHRDTIRFMCEAKQFVPSASTGQRRLLSILLRVSQAGFYTRKTGKKPVLLMDDVLLELDPEKRQRVTSLLPKYDQLFCTFLPGEPYERYKKSTTKVYTIQNGTWHE